MPAYKIASFELTDIHLIKYVAKTQKPMLISTGMGSLEEIEEAVKVARDAGNRDLLLFHCISSYPTLTADPNLNSLHCLAERFDCLVGLSDHTQTNLAASLAISFEL